jgi:hypothetical protein
LTHERFFRGFGEENVFSRRRLVDFDQIDFGASNESVAGAFIATGKGPAISHFFIGDS